MEEARRLAQIAPKVMNAFHDLGRQHPTDEKLSMRQYQALIVLSASTTLSLSRLCKKLGLAPSTGTELVNRMIQLGYIQKVQEAKDQRQINLTVTERGMELLEQRQVVMTTMFKKYLEIFSETDRQQFTQSFETILTIIEKYSSKQPSNHKRRNDE
ncbi:MarR family transcriptional regulator [candidate division KSB1 bacterium]|nr:MarR family transcriptional regulator [candidate division KSB1 bacterium]